MVGPEDVLSFWLDEAGEAGWYRQDDALDAEIRRRFSEAWEKSLDGRFSFWLTYPSGALAYIILTDQFPRNMFRNNPRAFASDRIALAAAKASIDKLWDMRINEPARQFFYMPLMHSENLCDQERCIRLVCDRMPKTGGTMLLHAQAHREVIRNFGRFPYRNAALQRPSRGPEADYVSAGGYGATIRELQEAS